MAITAKQNEYLQNCYHRWNIKYGATGSGKSFIDYAYTIPKRIDCTRGEGLIVMVGHTRETVEKNILEPMRGIWGDKLVPNLNNRPSIPIFNKKVYVIGADKVSSVAKIQGETIEYCYGDEMTTWNEQFFEMLKSRLRCEHSVFDGTCNPDSPTHFIKKFLDKPGLDIYQQKYVIDDNKFLPARVVADLKEEYAGTIYYQRYILGEWAKAEGLVFPHYMDALGKLDHTRHISSQSFAFSIDYGTMNAFACALWKKQDGIWYMDRCYYYSGRNSGIQKTDDEYLKDLEWEFADELNQWEEECKETTLPWKIPVIIDPSAASFIALLKKRKWAKVRPAANDVKKGIQDTNTAIHRGLIKVDPGIKEYQAEAGGYVWDEKSPDKEQPIKVDDHLMDSIRYFVETNHLVKPTRP